MVMKLKHYITLSIVCWFIALFLYFDVLINLYWVFLVIIISLIPGYIITVLDEKKAKEKLGESFTKDKAYFGLVLALGFPSGLLSTGWILPLILLNINLWFSDSSKKIFTEAEIVNKGYSRVGSFYMRINTKEWGKNTIYTESHDLENADIGALVVITSKEGGLGCPIITNVSLR